MLNQRGRVVRLGLWFVSFGLIALAGCATKAPPYQPSIDNVQQLKAVAPKGVKLGEFTVDVDAKNATSIGIRASSMSSSVGSNYADYVAQALRDELSLAGRIDPNSNIEISGVLMGTDIDTGMAKGSGYIEARFMVKNQGKVRFDKIKRGESSWESSFIGAIAIPRAEQSYPSVVQNLLTNLYSDPDFQQSLK